MRAGVEVTSAGRHLPSSFDVDGLAVRSVCSALLSAADLAEARGLRRPELTLDARHVACAFASERHLRRPDGPFGPSFARLSRFARTQDGWIRLHANYPHHRRALLSVLQADEDGALDAVGRRRSGELEDAIVAAGGAAAAVRSPRQWTEHEQGAATAALPLIERRRVGARPGRRPSARADPRQPAAGVRVLDLTRVIAGPVATRFLAALGADVLRIDPPQMPELELAVLDTCPGKRLAGLDLRDPRAAATLDGLLADADVLVHGYRPGALTAFGIDEDRLAARHPHLLVASLTAWGEVGPWATRRGFDSLVQAACGIASLEGTRDAPGALPVQALDHATGYLLAGAVLRELAARWRGDDAADVRLALVATAAELMRMRVPGQGDAGSGDCEAYRLTLEHPGGAVSIIAPPGALDGVPLRWDRAGRASAPSWRT